MIAPDEPTLRIGELSRRVGVSTDLLRAWERRYGLLRPQRTPGGYRLYSLADERRIQRMQEHIGLGVSPAQAAQLALVDDTETPAGWEGDAAELREALEGFDEPRAQELFDRLLGALTLETLLGVVVMPFLRDLGERWARGEVSVAQEHFASTLLRGRLLGLARGWDRGLGPRALLACAPREQHDLGLLAFALALRARGWRIVFLGPDTPVATLAEAADRLRPALVVVAAVSDHRFAGETAAELSELASRHRLVLGGGGATAEVAERLGVEALALSPADAARRADGLAAA